MQYDLIIIGGGIVGLATAVCVLEKNPHWKVIVLEKEAAIGRHQTGHNSGVIHSGIYYKPGSSKAENCIAGYKRLLEFCSQYGVKYELCGKIIVATRESQIPMLEELYRRGVANGLTGLRFLSKDEIRDHEPHAAGIRAIHVPQTGVIDYSEVIRKYAEVAVSYGGQICCNEKVIGLHYESSCRVDTEAHTYTSKKVVSCAGLMSDRVGKMTRPELPLQIIPFRGEYYTVAKEKEYLVKSLIYPVPDPAFPFLGVHFTRMIRGGVEAGPNAVFALKREGYKKTDFSLQDTYEALLFPGFRKVIRKYWRKGLEEYYRSWNKAAFVKALQELIPEIAKEDLIPGEAGVRAQACSVDGGLLDDFFFVEDHRILHVCNAPSPAATSSLSLGQSIASRIIRES
jgi:L-2-hydroxyglutarate oxidase